MHHAVELCAARAREVELRIIEILVGDQDLEIVREAGVVTQARQAAGIFQRRNLRPVVVLLMAQSFGNRNGNEDLAVALENRKVPVCRVYCDADLAATLSSFSTSTFSQDMSWRAPILSHLT